MDSGKKNDQKLGNRPYILYSFSISIELYNPLLHIWMLALVSEIWW